ncbi:hypothetical protein P7K49_000635 [Saguinus oedipus]|uniref:Uncharacterized protein n=1 Tax=Saguinus oedipus TaxID=9490 RepID=A0ABQ9WC74_SAGOE|nr:hypothetical protein P7K49_000635 [Saguinus oedipus]
MSSSSQMLQFCGGRFPGKHLAVYVDRDATGHRVTCRGSLGPWLAPAGVPAPGQHIAATKAAECGDGCALVFDAVTMFQMVKDDYEDDSHVFRKAANDITSQLEINFGGLLKEVDKDSAPGPGCSNFRGSSVSAVASSCNQCETDVGAFGQCCSIMDIRRRETIL